MFRGETWSGDAFEFFDRRRLRGAVMRARRFERQHRLRFHAIAGCGISGTVPATLLSQEMDRELLLLRKPNDKRGDYQKLVGAVPDGTSSGVTNYLVIDDLIESGRTMTHIRKLIESQQGTVAAIMLYARGGYDHLQTWKGIPVIELADV